MIERRDRLEWCGFIGKIGESVKSFEYLSFINDIHSKYCNKSLIYNRN